MISALKLLANMQEKENVIKVENESVKESSRRGLCRTAGPAPCGKRVVGPTFNLVDQKDAAVEQRPEKLTLRIGERRGQTAFVDTTRIDRNPWGLRWSIQNVSCAKQGVHVQCSAGGGEESGHQEDRGLHEIHVEAEREERRGQDLLPRTHKRSGQKQNGGAEVLEERAASSADALRICGQKAEAGAEGSSTYCSLEDEEDGPLCMQEHYLMW